MNEAYTGYFEFEDRYCCEGVVTPGSLIHIMEKFADTDTTIGPARDCEIRKKGICWIIARQHYSVVRMPKAGEKLPYKTWPGKTSHGLYPRFYEIYDNEGNLIVEGNAVWAVMNIETRQLAVLEDAGVSYTGDNRGKKVTSTAKPRLIDPEHFSDFTVTEEYTDINGHMNNARYLDACRQLVEVETQGLSLKDIRISYENEVMLGETITIRWAKTDNEYHFSGAFPGEEGKTSFRLIMKYE